MPRRKARQSAAINAPPFFTKGRGVSHIAAWECRPRSASGWQKHRMPAASIRLALFREGAAPRPPQEIPLRRPFWRKKSFFSNRSRRGTPAGRLRWAERTPGFVCPALSPPASRQPDSGRRRVKPGGGRCPAMRFVRPDASVPSALSHVEDDFEVVAEVLGLLLDLDARLGDEIHGVVERV